MSPTNISSNQTSNKSDTPVPSTAQPSQPTPTLSKSESMQTSISTSDAEDIASQPSNNTNSASRPPLKSRKSSGTMIVPADHPNIELKEESFPPNDARAMSPKRSSAETERMIGSSRVAIQSHASDLQSGLNALVEKVESIRTDHEKLEKNNNALQDYIGGLTKSMSQTALSTGRKK